MKPVFLNSGKVLPAGLPFSEAVRVGNTLYLSGQIGTTPGRDSPTLVEGGIAAETKQVMENIKATLEAHYCSLADVFKCTVMLANIAEWEEFNDVYMRYFSDHLPVRSAFGNSALAFGARVEVECMAYSELSDIPD